MDRDEDGSKTIWPGPLWNRTWFSVGPLTVLGHSPYPESRHHKQTPDSRKLPRGRCSGRSPPVWKQKKTTYDSISVILHCSLQKNVFLILDQVKIGVPSPSINQLMYCVKGKEEIDRMGYMGFILVLFYDKSEDCLTSMPRHCNTVFLYQYEHPQTLFTPALRIRALPLQFCCIKF